MPSPSTSTHHHHHTHHRRSRLHTDETRRHRSSSVPQPVWYFTGVILLLIVTRLLHVPLLPVAVGGLGLVVLSVSRLWRFKPGIIVSGICLFAMSFLYIWFWLQHYLGPILSPPVEPGEGWFMGGFWNGLILAALVWVYHRALNSVYHRMGHKWFIKKPFIIIVRMLFYFHIFLFFFWCLAPLSSFYAPSLGLPSKDAALSAAALALIAAGIPAIFYLSRNSPSMSARRHHHRHSVQAMPPDEN